MSEFSLVPVDHQPDFSDVSLVPVDHDPFGTDAVIPQARVQWTQTEIQPAQPQAQQLAEGTDQPGTVVPPVGAGPSTSPDQGNPEPIPFNGYANPTLTESLVNKAKMGDQERLIDADRTGKNGFIVDGNELYKFVTTKPAHRYSIDGGAGTVFTAIDPFYANDGTRTGIIEASPERPVTVTVRGDGSFSIGRP